MNQPSITQRQHDTLKAISDGKCDVAGLADALEVSVAAVRAQLRTLRDNGLVEGNSPELTVTADGQKMLGVEATRGRGRPAQRVEAETQTDEIAHREGSKIAKAHDIFMKNLDKGRKAVLDLFKSRLKMSDSGASTYYQTLRHETGVAYQQARNGGKSDTNKSNGADKSRRSNTRGKAAGAKRGSNRPSAK